MMMMKPPPPPRPRGLFFPSFYKVDGGWVCSPSSSFLLPLHPPPLSVPPASVSRVTSDLSSKQQMHALHCSSQQQVARCLCRFNDGPYRHTGVAEI